MIKKVITTLVAVLLISTFSVNAHAITIETFNIPSRAYVLERLLGDDAKTSKTVGIDDFIKGKDTKATDQFLVTITRPEGDETVFSVSYPIRGYTDAKDVCVALAIYDEATESYKDLVNTDGVSRWEVGASGVFTKEINLGVGISKLKIVAYKKSGENNLKLGENLQVNYFAITVLKQDVKDSILRDNLKISDMFDFFKN